MARRPGGRRGFRPSRAPLRFLVCAIGIAVITLTTGDLNQFPPVQSSAASPPSSSVVLGVLDDRGPETPARQWEIFADVLNQELPERLRVEIAPLGRRALQEGLQQEKLDFVLTDPVHHVLLREQEALSGPLVTLIRDTRLGSSAKTGAVVVTRAEPTAPASWPELQGRSVGLVSTSGSLSFLAVAEVLARHDLTTDDIFFDEQPASGNAVINGVLDGEYAAGIVRTSVFEGLSAAGEIDPDAVQIMGRRQPMGQPLVSSTPLWPGWVIAARQGVPDNMSTELAAALYALNPSSHTANDMGVAGFQVPADYSVVAEALASMHLAPFEQGPRFDVDDVLARYQTAIGVSGALVLMVVALLVALVAVYRRQAVLKDRFSRHEQRWLNQFRDFCENVPGMLFQYRQGPDGTVSFPFASPRIVETHGCSADEVAEDASVMFDLIEPADRLELSDALETSRQGLTPFDANYRVNHPVYGRRWMRGRATPSKDDDGGVTWHGYVQDVTDLKAFEAQRQLAASAFETIQEGLLISDEKHRIIKVNRACTQLLGYEAAEILGKPASLIMFETDREELAPRLIQELDQRSGAWKGQIRCRTKNGGTLPVELSIATVKTEELESIHHVGVFRDMREQLQKEAELERLATRDALTGLPNRRGLASPPRWRRWWTIAIGPIPSTFLPLKIPLSSSIPGSGR